MQANLRQEKTRQVVVFAVLAVAVILVDQFSKSWVLANLTRFSDEGVARAVPSRIVSVIPAVLQFRFARNSGAAFSMFQEHPNVLTTIAGAMSVAVLVWAIVFLKARERLEHVALGLVFGGAVGNLIDRIRYDRFVVDFIEIHWRGRVLWPTFNIADSAICIGVGLFLIAAILHTRAEAAEAKAQT